MILPRLTVGIVTMSAVPWALEDNFQRLAGYVRQAAHRRAQVVIAPESVIDGYVCAATTDVTHERMLDVAETVPDGPYLRRAADLCRELGIYLIYGFLERAGDELFNTCVLLDPHGTLLAKYSKVHPASESFITPGRELRPFDTPLGRIGFLICSDRGIPDNFSVLGVQGVETIYIPMDGSGGPDNTATLRVRARDTGCWIVLANTWSAVMINPAGEVVLENYQTECVSVQRLDLYAIPTGSQRRQIGRRPDLYGPLLTTLEADARFDAQGCPTPYEEGVRVRWQQQLRAHATGKKGSHDDA